MKKLKTPSINNLKILGEIMYNFTGLEYYLNLSLNYYTSVATCGTYRGHFFDFYFEVYKQVKENIQCGNTFEFPLYIIGTQQTKPFIYNSL
jgi:hypothetical protein